MPLQHFEENGEVCPLQTGVREKKAMKETHESI